jgi:hypothetical protein
MCNFKNQELFKKEQFWGKKSIKNDCNLCPVSVSANLTYFVWVKCQINSNF